MLLRLYTRYWWKTRMPTDSIGVFKWHKMLSFSVIELSVIKYIW